MSYMSEVTGQQCVFSYTIGNETNYVLISHTR